MNWKIGNDGPMVKLEYDNPYAGSNSYSNRVDPDDKYAVERAGGGGDNARVVFKVKQSKNTPTFLKLVLADIAQPE